VSVLDTWYALAPTFAAKGTWWQRKTHPGRDACLDHQPARPQSLFPLGGESLCRPYWLMVLARVPCLALCFTRQCQDFKGDTRVAAQSDGCIRHSASWSLGRIIVRHNWYEYLCVCRLCHMCVLDEELQQRLWVGGGSEGPVSGTLHCSVVFARLYKAECALQRPQAGKAVNALVSASL
jgi:hypothetical protein